MADTKLVLSVGDSPKLTLGTAIPVVGENNVAANVGAGAGVFKDKTGVSLNFRSVSSPNATVSTTEGTDEVELEALGLIETSGPTALLAGAIVDGEILIRSGATIISAAGAPPMSHAATHLPSGADPLTTAVPGASIDAADTAAEGTAESFARSDHQHAVSTGIAAGLDAASTNTEGSATDLARSDHTHDIDETGTVSTANAGDTPVAGAATGFARKDHAHGVSTASAAAIGQANAEGSSVSLARADHDHLLKESGGTEMNIGAVADGQALFRSGTTIIGSAIVTADELVGVSANDSTPGYLGAKIVGAGGTSTLELNDGGDEDLQISSPPLTAASPADVSKSAAVVGVSVEIARADHKHDISTAASSALDAASTNTEGSATSLSRSDHTHDLSTGAPSAGIGAGNTEGSAASLARSDHDHTLRESGGQDLTLGGVADGEALVRSGTSIIGSAIATSDELVKVSVNDTTPGFLFSKLVSAGGITLTELNDGADEDVEISSPALTASTPANVTKSAAAVGIATDSARADHKHDVGTAAPSIGVGSGNTEGSATTLARSDHNHTLRESGGQDLTFGAVADGELLQRSGTTIVGASSALTPRQERVTTETITNSDTAIGDTLNFTPTSDASVQIFFNGLLQIQGAGESYSISGTTITWLASTGTAVNMKTTDDLVAVYWS